MITYDTSLLKDSFLIVEMFPEPCQTSNMKYFLEYSQVKAESHWLFSQKTC